jgi:hypothetical protein
MLRLTKVSVVVSLAVAATAQQPEALFDAPIVELPSDLPPFEALLDYDGDGDMDAVGGRVKSDGSAYDVRVWRNQQGRYVQVFADLQNAVGGAGIRRLIVRLCKRWATSSLLSRRPTRGP